MVVGALVLTGASLWCRRSATPSWAVVLIGGLAARVALLPLEPGLSDDAYRYVWDGLLQLRGLNPFLYLPTDPALADLRQSELFSLLNSRERYTVYPPLSQAVFAASALAHQADTLTAYYAVKGFMVLFDVGALLLLGRLTGPRNLILYAWNPLILIELAGQGHAEAIMAFFLVATVWLLREGWENEAAAALTLAGWVKLYPFFLMPFLLRRIGWRRIWVPVLTSVLVWAPYASTEVVDHVLSSLRLYVQLFEFNAGPYYLVKEIFRWVTGADWSKQIGPAFAVLFLCTLPLTYRWDRATNVSWETAAVGVTGLYFALATTVHPWYLVGILALLPLLDRVRWHWIWLSAWSMGTYLFYVDGPYWPFVWIGWGGWGLLLAASAARTRPADRAGLSKWTPALLAPLMRRRARSKVELIRAHLPPSPARILDVGCGEGYVGELLHEEGYRVEGVDVLPLHRTNLPFRVYDGDRLPFEADVFDGALLVYVLHHADDPRHLLEETLRVSRRVVVLESVYEHPWERAVLRWADRFANRLRSGGRMKDRRPRLRTDEEWRAICRRTGTLVHAEVEEGGPHHRARYVLESHTD